MARPYKTLTPEQELEVKSRYMGGEGLIILAADVGVATATLSKILKTLGVDVRGRGRPKDTKVVLPAPDPEPIKLDPEDAMPEEHKSETQDPRFSW